MKEYLEFRLALQEVVAAGYSVGLGYNQKQGDWRAILAFPGANVQPWTARGKTIEEAFMAAAAQWKSGIRSEQKQLS